MPILEIKNLGVYYRLKKSMVRAVDGVNLQIEKGENLGIVGESGCGKSTLAKAIIMVMPRNTFIPFGEILFKGKDLTRMNEAELTNLRWKDISMIPQGAMNVLDPVYRVGAQIVEAIRQHKKTSKNEAWDQAVALFQMVGLDEACLKDYPHQLSGGMRQRSIIAMALALDPSLIIADEPTTALDVITQDQILKKFVEQRKKIEASMIFITHDISVVAQTCDKIAVMYAGKIMEYGRIREIIRRPYHPYTMGLQNSFLSIDIYHEKLISIPGFPPDLIKAWDGCLFYDRCPFSEKICLEDPETLEVEQGHYSACYFPDEVEKFRRLAPMAETWMGR